MRRVTIMVVATCMLVALCATAALAATVHGTKNHDWGKAKDMFGDPPGCKVRCGKIVRGTGGKDTIYGHAGWDYIAAYGGSDVIHGGLGMEIIHGGRGNDRIFGERGHDHVFGDAGDDRIYVQDGRDERGDVEHVSGGVGRDLCVVDEDPRDGLIAHKSCEKLVIKNVPRISGATKIFNSMNAKNRGDTVPGKFYPGTYHLKK